MMKILFVCLGNICRSPMAEGLMKKRINDAGYAHLFHVESRATSSYEIGRFPHPKTMQILQRENASLRNKRAQKIAESDFDNFDLIIGMDKENVQDLLRMKPDHKHKIYLLRDISLETANEDVPDPYYTGKYEETFCLIDESLEQWMNHFKKSLDLY